MTERFLNILFGKCALIQQLSQWCKRSFTPSSSFVVHQFKYNGEACTKLSITRQITLQCDLSCNALSTDQAFLRHFGRSLDFSGSTAARAGATSRAYPIFRTGHWPDSKSWKRLLVTKLVGAQLRCGNTAVKTALWSIKSTKHCLNVIIWQDLCNSVNLRGQNPLRVCHL